MEHFLNRNCRVYRYDRNAVERHWDPDSINLSVNRERLALFSAGEAVVTEDLAPLAVVLEGIEDQMFITTQLYEEAKHAVFFDQYRRKVVHSAEDAHGLKRTSPLDGRWFFDTYHDLFERNERSMRCPLTDDTSANHVREFCHYHLTTEGPMAQTGYYAVQMVYNPRSPNSR